MKHTAIVVVAILASTIWGPTTAGAAPAPADAGTVVSRPEPATNDVDTGGDPLTPALRALAAAGAPGPSTSAATSADTGRPASGPGSIAPYPGHRILVETRTSGAAATDAAVALTGAEVLSRSGPNATLALEPARLDALAATPGLRSAQEVLLPSASAPPTTLRGADSPATNAVCDNGGTGVVSQGDAQLKANLARSLNGIDGTGVKIGILSSSFNARKGLAADEDSGDLPGTQNPCKHTTEVQVLRDDLCPDPDPEPDPLKTCLALAPASTNHSDEGRAMAQIVHDLAPGATMVFASANFGEQTMADDIVAMQGEGATIIVDDITYLSEPMFQDGVIAAAVNTVTALGVSYFSSTGNSTKVADNGRPVGSYEASTYRPAPCPAAIAALGQPPLDCHDFDPDVGVDPGDLVTMDAGTDANPNTLKMSLGWDEPALGIATDLNLYLVKASTDAVVRLGQEENLTTQRASEFLAYDVPETGQYRIVIGRKAGAGTPRLKWVSHRSKFRAVQWDTVNVDLKGFTMFGHNAALAGFSVGAVPATDATISESFSSYGPAVYCWEPVDTKGVTTAKHFPVSAVNPTGCKPKLVDFSATDGVTTTIAGFAPFFGTSAAAPHAAAVAGLMLQKQSCRSPSEVGASLWTTAHLPLSMDLSVAGAGLIDASAAVTDLRDCKFPGQPIGFTATPGNAQLTLAWNAPKPSPDPLTAYQVKIYPGRGPSGARPSSETIEVAAPATSFVIPGMNNGQKYVVTLLARNVNGDSPAAGPLQKTPQDPRPLAPAFVAAGGGNGQATIDWSVPPANGGSPVTGYQVFAFQNGTFVTGLQFTSTATTEVFSPLTNGVAYTFTVAAMNGAGVGAESAMSAPVTPTATPGTPAAPTGVSAVAGNGLSTIFWSAPSSDGGSAITGYEIKMFSGIDLLVTTQRDTTATSTTVAGDNGTTYTFTVAAKNAAGPGTASTPSNPVTPAAAPSVPIAPTNVIATGHDGNATLAWTAPAVDGGSPITGYEIGLYHDGILLGNTQRDTPATTASVAGANGTSYTYTVAAKNAIGTGAASAPSNLITPLPAPAPPWAPFGLTAVAGPGSATLTWSEPFDNFVPIDKYWVVPIIDGTPLFPIPTPTSALTYTASGFAAGMKVTFTVAAQNASGTGLPSAPEGPVTILPTTVPGAPEIGGATAGDGHVALSWLAPTIDGGLPIDRYRITPFRLGQALAPIDTPTAAVSFDVLGLTDGKRYEFTVKAHNELGFGPASATSDKAQPTVCANPAGGGPFPDVPRSHPFCGAIEYLAGSGIAGGYSDGNFRPTNPVTRQAMAAFLFRYDGQPAVALTEPFFADVATDHPFYAAIQFMADRGLSTGTPNPAGGKPLYRPSDPVSRLAMAAFLWRHEGEQAVVFPDPFFADVAPGSTFYQAIQWMAEKGISFGTPNPPNLPLYKPASPVSRQAMAAFLLRDDDI